MRPSPLAYPGFVKAFRDIVARISKAAGAGARTRSALRMYVAGGAAVHFYTGARITDDVDAAFSRRLLVPDNLEVAYTDRDGKARLLYFDKQYNETFGLVHEDAHADALPLELEGIDRKSVDLRLFSPLDLAVSKLARFAQNDRDDIRALARAGLIGAAELRRRAEEALAGYVGEEGAVRTSIALACGIVSKEKPRSRRSRRRPPSY
ncbi:MAG: DUF6036 family nucleotidyltransferase [Burkholderiales bacterium]